MESGGAKIIAAGAQTILIADARNAPLGTVVTVEGSVTVPSGSFTASEVLPRFRGDIHPAQ